MLKNMLYELHGLPPAFLYRTDVILPNFSEKDVEIVVFERVRGIVHTDNITLRAGNTTIIDTPWDKGVYTIIFKLSNGYILLGDFIII